MDAEIRPAQKRVPIMKKKLIMESLVGRNMASYENAEKLKQATYDLAIHKLKRSTEDKL